MRREGGRKEEIRMKGKRKEERKETIFFRINGKNFQPFFSKNKLQYCIGPFLS